MDCGGNLALSYPNDEVWNKFCDHTTWKKDSGYVNYPKPFFEDNFMCMKEDLPFFPLTGVLRIDANGKVLVDLIVLFLSHRDL